MNNYKDNYWKKISKILYLESYFQSKSFSIFLKLKKHQYRTSEEFIIFENEMLYWNSLRERARKLGEKIHVPN